MSLRNPELVIYNAQISDSGSYKCCVNNTDFEQCGNDIVVGCKYDIFTVFSSREKCKLTM